MKHGLHGVPIDFDSVEATLLQRETLRTKQCIRDIYVETYQEIAALAEKHFNVSGEMLEIGSGGGFLKDICPAVITSDTKALPHVDLHLDARSLPFDDGALRCIFAVHVLHHIPDVRAFFREALRVLKPGGGLVCVEPYWSPLARLIYGRFHVEPFDMSAATWELPEGGPMSISNQALSYILLRRDRAVFRREFPALKVKAWRLHGFLRYLCSGGMWLPQKVPTPMFGLLKCLDWLATPIMPLVALHHTFVLQVDEDQPSA